MVGAVDGGDDGADIVRRNLDPESAAATARHAAHHATYASDSGMAMAEYGTSVLPFRLIAFEAGSREERAAGGDAAAVQSAGNAAAETYDGAANIAQDFGRSVSAAIAAGRQRRPILSFDTKDVPPLARRLAHLPGALAHPA